MAAVGRPIIGRDPLERADPLALAAHLLLFGQGGARSDLRRIDEHPFGAGRRVDRPEIVAVAIVGAVAQQGRELAVGRQLERARARPRQRRALEQSLERQLLCGQRGGCGHGERDSKGVDRVHGPISRAFRERAKKNGGRENPTAVPTSTKTGSGALSPRRACRGARRYAPTCRGARADNRAWRGGPRPCGRPRSIRCWANRAGRRARHPRRTKSCGR